MSARCARLPLAVFGFVLFVSPRTILSKNIDVEKAKISLWDEFGSEIERDKEELEAYVLELAARALGQVQSSGVQVARPEPPIVYQDPTPEQIRVAVERTQRDIGFDTLKWNSSLQSYSLLRMANQFGPERNQGSAPVCDTFASLSLLEAGYFRQSRRLLDFSEMWVMRASLGARILTNRGFRSFDLSLPPQTVLDAVKEHGICEEKKFAYSTQVVNKFIYGGEPLSDAEKSLKENLVKFAKYFQLSSELNDCRKESDSLKQEFQNYRIIRVEQKIKNIVHLLSFGIPIRMGIAGFYMLPDQAHAVDVIGYDLETQKFWIRNSWGSSSSAPHAVPFSWALPNSDGTIRIFYPQALIVPADVRRACEDPTNAPQQVAGSCQF